MDEDIYLGLLRIFPFLVLLLVVYLRIRFKKIKPADLYIQKPASTSRYFICTLGFLVFVVLTEFILFQAGILEVDKWNHKFFASVIRIFGMIILAPIAEELVFRGIFLHLLTKRKVNLHVAIFIQAALFVLMHNFAYRNTITDNIGVAQTFIDATLFAYAKYYSRSLNTPITMHITGNLVATVERFVLH